MLLDHEKRLGGRGSRAPQTHQKSSEQKKSLEKKKTVTTLRRAWGEVRADPSQINHGEKNSPKKNQKGRKVD